MNLIRVSVSEAARLFGVDQKTIRRAIQAKELRYIVVRGRYKIQFESLVAWSQSKAGLRKKNLEQGIGQFIEKWKIRNTLYSPNPQIIRNKQLTMNNTEQGDTSSKQ